MTHDQVQKWLDRYMTAWRSGDPEAIRDLFSSDATYGYRPWDSEQTTARGAEAIVAGWLENYDDPSSWEAAYTPYAVDGDRAVALGTTRYFASGDHAERTYHNAFILRFDQDGRCREFNEFFVRMKD